MMLDVRKTGMAEAQARALAPDPERRERLEYLADLLSELKTLAERERCDKLPGLIAKSREEAIAESLKD